MRRCAVIRCGNEAVASVRIPFNADPGFEPFDSGHFDHKGFVWLCHWHNDRLQAWIENMEHGDQHPPPKTAV